MEENNEEKNDKSIFKGFRSTINKFYFIGTIILTIVLSIVCIKKSLFQRNMQKDLLSY